MKITSSIPRIDKVKVDANSPTIHSPEIPSPLFPNIPFLAQICSLTLRLFRFERALLIITSLEE
jgi:hypothetical protein